jgi:hypothetical protein
MTIGDVAPAGDLGLLVLDRQTWAPRWPTADNVRVVLERGLPQRGLADEVNEWRASNIRNLWRGARTLLAAKALKVPTHYGALWGRVIRGDGTTVDLGLMSLRVVTDTGVAFIVDAFQNSVELENMKFHGYGTGTTAESAAQTALVTELTTQYAADSTRPTGTTTEGAANIYRTVATLSPDTGGTIAITEHGVFSQAATGGGVMIDRSVFSAVNLVAGSDSLQTTYDLTFTSGS